MTARRDGGTTARQKRPCQRLYGIVKGDTTSQSQPRAATLVCETTQLLQLMEVRLSSRHAGGSEIVGTCPNTICLVLQVFVARQK